MANKSAGNTLSPKEKAKADLSAKLADIFRSKKRERKRYFYLTDGTRRSVGRSEYNRLVSAQSKRTSTTQKQLSGRYSRALKKEKAKSRALTGWSAWREIVDNFDKRDFIRSIYDTAKASRVDAATSVVEIELKWQKDGKQKRKTRDFPFSRNKDIADSTFIKFFDVVIQDDVPETVEGRLAAMFEDLAAEPGVVAISGRYMSADSSGAKKFRLENVSKAKARYRFKGV